MVILIAAVPLETALLRQNFQQENSSDSPFPVLRGHLGRHLVVLTHAGAGKAGAAAAASHLLTRTTPDLVISFGCGGSYPESGLGLGDLAVATESLYGDEGVLSPEGFLDMEDLGLPLAQTENGPIFNRFPTDRSLTQALRHDLEKAVAPHRVGFGPVVTVSTCSGTLAAGREIVRRTGGIAENMEGAAVAQICAIFRVPFLEFRGISNPVEDRDRFKWDLSAGAETAQRAVLSALDILGRKPE